MSLLKKAVKKITKKTVAKKVSKKAVKKTVKKTVQKAAPKKTVKKVAKKAVKKIAAKTPAKKKAPVKKTVSKNKHVRALVCADPEHCFWTTDGNVLEDLNQLQLAFGSMDDEVFLHHVTKEKNDFADWVEHILEDQECAHALRSSKKPRSSRTAVVRVLRNYNL